MNVYRYGEQDIPRHAEASLTLGTFDGVHLGHHHLLDEVLKGQCPTVLTFDPHPRHVLSAGPERFKILTPIDEKLRKLGLLGIQRTVILPFDKEVASISAETFLKNILIDTIGMKRLVVGFNHSFGRNREGNIDFMREHAPEYGYELKVVEAREEDSMAISSTRIRLALESGKLDKANQYLGERYRTEATVITGEGRGRSLGYPTANLRFIDRDQLVPAEGVYAVQMRLENEQWYDGVASIGRKETFSSIGNLAIEVHLFDHDSELYGQVVWVEWVEYLRGQEAFDSVDELIEQMHEDATQARKILKSVDPPAEMKPEQRRGCA